MSWQRPLRGEEKQPVLRALLDSRIANESICREAVDTCQFIAFSASFPPVIRGIRPLVAYLALRRRASGITLGRQIYVRHNLFATDGDLPLFLVGHEVAHVAQFLRDGTVPFLARYVGEYAAQRAGGLSDRHAYLAISYEREARQVEARLQSDTCSPSS